MAYLRRGLRLLLSLPKTIYFNFRYFPFTQALKLPVFIDSSVRLLKCGGKVILDFKPGLFCIKIGGSDDVIANKSGNGLRWKVEGTVIFGGGLKMCYGCGVSVEKEATLAFGAEGFFNVGTLIICAKSIRFGRNVSVSWNCTFIDSDFHDIVDEVSSAVINNDKEIDVGDYVWIGHDCVIKKGVYVSQWNIIGSNSVVVKSITGQRQIWGGVPAKLLRENCYRPSLDNSVPGNKKYR